VTQNGSPAKPQIAIIGGGVAGACVARELSRYKLKVLILEKDNALLREWKGVCWMNPPYGRTIGKRVKKAYEQSLYNNATVVCLIPSRTETNWWWNYCMKGEIRFIRGRLKFGGRNTKGEYVRYPATFGSAIVVFK
jgi:cation diffusion facilitator CzcD-associated flavoprotein CzcO